MGTSHLVIIHLRQSRDISDNRLVSRKTHNTQISIQEDIVSTVFGFNAFVVFCKCAEVHSCFHFVSIRILNIAIRHHDLLWDYLSECLGCKINNMLINFVEHGICGLF